MSDTPKMPLENEDAVARIIRLAGHRPVADDAARARVYAATHARWRQSVAAAPTRRVMPWLAAAAALVVAAVGITLLRSPDGVANAAVATLQTARRRRALRPS